MIIAMQYLYMNIAGLTQPLHGLKINVLSLFTLCSNHYKPSRFLAFWAFKIPSYSHNKIKLTDCRSLKERYGSISTLHIPLKHILTRFVFNQRCEMGSTSNVFFHKPYFIVSD